MFPAQLFKVGEKISSEPVFATLSNSYEVENTLVLVHKAGSSVAVVRTFEKP